MLSSKSWTEIATTLFYYSAWAICKWEKTYFWSCGHGETYQFINSLIMFVERKDLRHSSYHFAIGKQYSTCITLVFYYTYPAILQEIYWIWCVCFHFHGRQRVKNKLYHLFVVLKIHKICLIYFLHLYYLSYLSIKYSKMKK